MIRTTPTCAWKGHDFDVLNDLNDEDMIWQEEHPSHSKYVYLTDAGVQYAKKLMKAIRYASLTCFGGSHALSLM